MSSSFEFPELTAPPPVAQLEAASEAERREEAAAALVEAAREEGFDAGREAGRVEVASAAEALAAAAAALDQERAEAAARAERAAADLGLALAGKVLGTALETKPELVVEVVRGAVRRLVEPQESTLLVNPDDVEIVREAVEELAAEHGAPLTVRAERRVPRGGCILRTQAGEIDARIAGQLDRAAAIVAGEAGG